MVKRVKFYQTMKLHNVAAFEIQRHWQMYRQRRQQRRLVPGDDDDDDETDLVRHAKFIAQKARKIQRAWRASCDYRVYEALRDTISTFRRSGDPYLLLKSVVPREAMLLDPAMQVHVRFRLGGTRFPPSIYYKVFTHGAIIDMNSFAPRDYAAERELGIRTRPGDLGWYERVENNGWRPIVVRLVPQKERAIDEVEKETSKKKVRNFHYSRLRRRQDIEKQKRMRSIEWFRKMHGLTESEMPEGESQDIEWIDEGQRVPGIAVGSPSGIGGVARLATQNAGPAQALTPRPPSGAPPAKRVQRLRPSRPSSAASGESDTSRSEHLGQNVSQQEFSFNQKDHFVSDDMLLDWTRKLDFDSYMNGWKNMATTDCSEGNLPIARFSAGLAY